MSACVSGRSGLVDVAELVGPPALPLLGLDAQVRAGDRFQDRQCAVVEQVDAVVGRIEKMNVHGQSLLQILIGHANRFEFLGDQDILRAARLSATEHDLQGQLPAIRGVRPFAASGCCGTGGRVPGSREPEPAASRSAGLVMSWSSTPRHSEGWRRSPGQPVPPSGVDTGTETSSNIRVYRSS